MVTLASKAADCPELGDNDNKEVVDGCIIVLVEGTSSFPLHPNDLPVCFLARVAGVAADLPIN